MTITQKHKFFGKIFEKYEIQKEMIWKSLEFTKKLIPAFILKAVELNEVSIVNKVY